ncbi:MAG: hypothetical protein ACOZNI_13895 [Myxococcota bacterium]
MDTAVDLVQAYLRVNGYFTVTEYPIVEAVGGTPRRTLTDVDVLAFRFPGAGRRVKARRSAGGPVFAPDPALGCPADRPDMLIGEVKEGPARLNAPARDPEVLAATLARFGCCHPDHAPHVVRALIRDGEAPTHGGHTVRLVAFGSGARPGNRCRVVDLGHVIAYLADFLREDWALLGQTELKDPALGFLALLEKARAARREDP